MSGFDAVFEYGPVDERGRRATKLLPVYDRTPQGVPIVPSPLFGLLVPADEIAHHTFINVRERITIVASDPGDGWRIRRVNSDQPADRAVVSWVHTSDGGTFPVMLKRHGRLRPYQGPLDENSMSLYHPVYGDAR